MQAVSWRLGQLLKYCETLYIHIPKRLLRAYRRSMAGQSYEVFRAFRRRCFDRHLGARFIRGARLQFVGVKANARSCEKCVQVGGSHATWSWTEDPYEHT